MDLIFKWLAENWYAIAGLFVLVVILLLIFRWRDKLKESWKSFASKHNLKLLKKKEHEGVKPLNKMVLKGESGGIEYSIFALEKDPDYPFSGVGSTTMTLNLKNRSLILHAIGILNKTRSEMDGDLKLPDVDREKIQDAALGDPDFNTHFKIATNALIDARRIFDRENQEMLLSHLTSGFVATSQVFLTIDLKKGKLKVKKSTVLSKEDDLLNLTNLGLQLARKTKIGD